MAKFERHLAAIMFTDIQGYTALMGADEQKALTILRESRQIQKLAIEKHNGKWLKEMGDGVLAQFESALDAVNCALEIQKDAHSELDAKIRIGVHLGDVTIENEDVFGDGVNIASRLQALADPGGIYISESIFQAVHANPQIKAEYLADVELKNVSRPIAIYFLCDDWLPVPSTKKIKELKASGPKYIFPALIVILIGLALTVWWFTIHDDQDGIRSIVVLPVTNLSGDSSNNILLAGIHTELRDQIAKIKDLRVVSRTSSIKYQNVRMSIPEIADELNVDVVIEPDIYRYGDSVSMQVRLIKAFPEETQLWSLSFKRPASKAISIYNDIALAIARETDVDLNSMEVSRLKDALDINPEAHEAYLKGIGYLYTGTRQGLEKAKEYFDLSLEKDPLYARGYLGLSLVWGFRKQMGYSSYEEAQPFVEEYSMKAIEIDSSLTEIHYMLAVSNVWSYWNWEKAEKEFIRTIELDPYHVEARAYYAHFLNIMQRSKEASVQMEKALKLEPYNTWVQALYGMYLNHTRQYEKARKRLLKILEEESNPIASPALWTIYHNMGKYEQAMQTAREVYTERREYVAVEKLITGYQEGGYRSAMERVAEAFQIKKDTSFFPAWQLATLYTRADNKEKAVEWLENAFEEHDQNMPYISCDPIFDNIDDHPRFQALLQKMDLQRLH